METIDHGGDAHQPIVKGWDGINQCEVVIQTKKDASFQGDWTPVGISWSEIFFNLFPAVWLFDCCMKAT